MATERDRIARDLHDVIAHSVSVMTVQAGAARMQLPDHPDRAVPPLVAVEETGRQALAEMRSLLGILREDGAPALAPQPGLTDLPALAESVRQAGVEVEITVEGSQRLLPPASTSPPTGSCRSPSRTRLSTPGRPGRRSSSATTPTRSAWISPTTARASRAAGRGSGHGLPGMRERVSLYGGQLRAGPGRDSGFAVSSRLPIEPQP